MSQIIIIESVAELAEQIEQKYLHHGSIKIKQAIFACLHPIEVPSNVKELVNIIRLDSPVDNGEFIEHRWEILLDEAAALITAHSRTVPTAMLDDAAEIEAGLIQYYGEYTQLTEASKKAIAEKYGYRAE